MCYTGLSLSRPFAVRWTCYVVVVFLLLHCVHLQESYERPEILSLHISSDIKYRFATTLIVSRVMNSLLVSKEVVFDVTLPNEAFITDFAMEIEGTVYPGEIKEKELAKAQYETARSRGESAAHVKERPRETNKFDVQVNVAAGSMVIFNLTYQELLSRKHGLYHHVIYIDPGQPVLDMNVRVHIQESRDIPVVRVPPLRNDLNEIRGLDTQNLVLITKPSPNTAFIQFAPSIQQQRGNNKNGISGQFVVEYDIERSPDAGEILVFNGYFVHFFAPSGFKPFPKDILFIVDESGSMAGKKMEQLKEAMNTILSDLHKSDRINIMTFTEGINFWKTEMVICTEESIMAAKEFVKGRIADGGTNINTALLEGIKHLIKQRKSEIGNPIILFLTDGEATYGETNSDRILENIDNENKWSAIPMFTLAFGHDADYNLLKSISLRNYGVARKIYEASDAGLQIIGFYNEISAALMTDLSFKYLDGFVDNATVTKSYFKRYLDGSEVVVAGKMSNEESKTVPLQVIGNSIDGSTVLIIASDILEYGDFTNMTTLASIETITEKMWAYLTIKQFMEKADAATGVAEKESLKASALALALKYKFVTPLTSMVVTKPKTKNEETSFFDVGFQDDTKSSFHRGNIPSLLSKTLFRATHFSAFPLAEDSGMDSFDSMVDNDPIPFQLSIPQTTMRTPIYTGAWRPHRRLSDKEDAQLPIGKRWSKRRGSRKKVKKSKPSQKRYPIRIKFANAPYATCFNIPVNESNYSNQLEQLLHSPDGIEINADVWNLAQNNVILAINVTVKSTLVEISSAAISIHDVNNRYKYDWGNHDVILSDIKLHVKPATVVVEAEGLNIMIYKLGNLSNRLGLFINETTFSLHSSATGLLANLMGGKRTSYGISFAGHDSVFHRYKLTNLKMKDAWHGDSKCYTIQSDNLWNCEYNEKHKICLNRVVNQPYASDNMLTALKYGWFYFNFFNPKCLKETDKVCSPPEEGPGTRFEKPANCSDWELINDPRSPHF